MRQLVMAVGLAALVAGPAGAQMPDPLMMSGQAVPSGDLPTGTVSVRVVRDSMSNNVVGVEVELHGAGDVRRATTGPDGRAQFTGLPGGVEVHAITVVDGQRLESLAFQVPSSGGIRTLLAARSGAGSPPAGGGSAPAAPGAASAGASADLSIGGNSRIVLEFQDDALTVFYLLEIVNRTNAAITPASALIFDMPTGATGTAVMEGHTVEGAAKGPRVTTVGPFPPGVSSLPIAYRMDLFGPRLTIEQRFPLPMAPVLLAVEKVGPLSVSSPQTGATRETSLSGTPFLVSDGPALASGAPLTIVLEQLPHQSRRGLYLALGVAALIVAWGVWAGQRGAGGERGAEARRRDLLARREKGLAALAALETGHRAGRVAPDRYHHQRASLVEQLERIYGELDERHGPPGGGQGLAA